MGADIDLEGISDLLDTLSLYGANVNAATNDALKAAATPILKEAQETTAFHDRTGKLRKSLKLSRVTGNKYQYKYIRVFTDSPHAHLVEFGHSGNTAPAHPFLDPAYEHHKEEAQEIIKAKLREALR